MLKQVLGDSSSHRNQQLGLDYLSVSWAFSWWSCMPQNGTICTGFNKYFDEIFQPYIARLESWFPNPIHSAPFQIMFLMNRWAKWYTSEITWSLYIFKNKKVTFSQKSHSGLNYKDEWEFRNYHIPLPTEMTTSKLFFYFHLKKIQHSGTWAAQSVEHATPDLRVLSPSPILGMDPT